MNLSTIEGVSRNRISASGIKELAILLQKNRFIENLDLSSIGLGNAGFEEICEALKENNPKNMPAIKCLRLSMNDITSETTLTMMKDGFSHTHI